MKGWMVLAVALLLLGAYVFRKRLKRFYNLIMSGYKYFSYAEFDSPDKPGSGEKHMSKELIRRLDGAREIAGVPFKILSGYRTEAHNTKVGGVANSSHLSGLAADIDYSTEEEKVAILTGLRKMDFNRFGIRTGASGSSIHVDIDPDKSQYVVWGYNNVAPAPNPFSLA